MWMNLLDHFYCFFDWFLHFLSCLCCFHGEFNVWLTVVDGRGMAQNVRIVQVYQSEAKNILCTIWKSQN